jgi:hypothetical protein
MNAPEQPTPEALAEAKDMLRNFSHDWDMSAGIKAVAARIDRFATKRAAEAVAALHCAACDGPYPNPDCPHLRNASDMGERIPCVPALPATPPPGDADDIRTLPDSSNRSADIGVVESAAKTEAHSTSAPCGAATVETSLSTVTPPGDAGERARDFSAAVDCAHAQYENYVRQGQLNTEDERRAALRDVLSHAVGILKLRSYAALQSERTAAASQAVADERVRHDAAVLLLVQRMETPTIKRAVRDLTALGLSPECAKILGKAIYGAAEERDEARAAASQARREAIEECALIADSLPVADSVSDIGYTCRHIAKTIRALATPQE